MTRVPLSLIDPPSPILRHFREDTVGFQELVTQIKDAGGCLQAPPARPRLSGRFQLVDGYRRFRAHKIANLDEMTLNIIEMTDSEYLRNQMLCNAMHEDTDWIDYARHLDRLRRLEDEEMSLDKLAEVCGRSTTWVRKILQLNNLLRPVADMVKRGEITIGNAKSLARLPRSLQPNLIDGAKLLNTRQFDIEVTHALVDYREQMVKGKYQDMPFEGRQLAGYDNMKKKFLKFENH